MANKGMLPSYSTLNQDLDWWHGSTTGHEKAGREKTIGLSRSRLQVWFFRASTSILLWICLIQLITFRELWQSQMFYSCLKQIQDPFPRWKFSTTSALMTDMVHESTISPSILYESNGFLMISCNGGLNQMRAAICDMVSISKYLNVTLVLPELDKTSFWADPSEFGDVFDTDHFMSSLKNDVHIIKTLPPEYVKKVEEGNYLTLAPVSWSNETYYMNQILPLIQKFEVLRMNKTDSRLANNGLPPVMQRLRCYVNYHALRFTPGIEELGRRLVQILRARGPFLVLHLRYEKDMLAFSGCTHSCTDQEAEELTKLRYACPWWKEKVIDSEQKRNDGLCPLTPEETTLVLKALGYNSDTQIYVAAGEIYGQERRMAGLLAAFPNVVRKEILLSEEELKPFVNRSSQMAGLDYLVSLASDVFIPTHDGNMAKVVEGHRRYLGHRMTVLLDRKRLVGLLDLYENKLLPWDEFAMAVKQIHKSRTGSPALRRTLPGRPKEEDYFYSNPQECLFDNYLA